ncbi:hypothetical protein SAMN04487954_102172 [Billgrantia gudaonensis]|uniref:Cytochrome c domain-containing protein n=2 Tax=Billgrantia gudaonensis TaxID=376427 RepID=A0A1G8PRQ7_9GAMM|nr:hypothetical protein SAMN04487954_102172 [Halomonas gudaonensis]
MACAAVYIGIGMPAMAENDASRNETATAPQATAMPDGDAGRGATMAHLCENCHGPDGHSLTSRYPAIAGLPESRIIERLTAFRAGESSHLMESMTRGLSDQDIADLAAHFSRLE